MEKSNRAHKQRYERISYPRLRALLVVCGCGEWNLLLQSASHGAPLEDTRTPSARKEGGDAEFGNNMQYLLLVLLSDGQIFHT